MSDQPIAESEALPVWITTDYVMGKYEPNAHQDFTLIRAEHADREGMYVRKEAYEAFQKMYDHALKDGHRLIIRSAARNFNYQKGIWERKWKGETILSDGTKASDISDRKGRAKKILLYSSMPGTSRHHWGTDIDLNSFNNEYFKQGAGGKIYDWLKTHAATYGFCQPYTDKASGRTGYEEERWHWSYQPIAKDLTRYSKEHLSNQMITGFLGDEAAQEIDVVTNYILGISSVCM